MPEYITQKNQSKYIYPKTKNSISSSSKNTKLSKNDRKKH